MNRLVTLILLCTVAGAATTLGAQPLRGGGGLSSFSLGSNPQDSGQPRQQSLDGIAAIVNDDVILKSRLAQAVAQAKQRSRRNIPRNTLRSRVLDRLIMKKLQLQQAHREGVTISDKELQRGIKRVADNNDMSPSEFKRAAQQHGMSLDKLKDRIRTQMLVAKLRRRSVMSKISVTADDVNQYMRTQNLQQGIQSAYRFRGIRKSADDNADTVREQLNRLRRQADDGVAFSKLEEQASNDPISAEHAVVDWTAASQLQQPIANTLASLDQGEVSHVVRQGNQLMLLKLLGRRRAGSQDERATVTQVKARHIVVKANAIRTQGQTKELADRVRREITAGDAFATVAKQYSDDKSTASDGGDLGWIGVNQVSSKTRRALAQLEPGEVSPVLSAANGFEIIKLEKRRQQNQAEKQRRNKARQALGKQQASERGKVWKQKLRDRAFVDVRIDNYQPPASS